VGLRDDASASVNFAWINETPESELHKHREVYGHTKDARSIYMRLELGAVHLTLPSIRVWSRDLSQKTENLDTYSE